jgi:hypothetical protein
MIEKKNLDDQSISPIMEGCDPDFLDKLPTHLAFIKNFFQRQGVTLDGTVAQLQYIEELIIAKREISEIHTSAFLQGLIAYCGELICIDTPGNWQLVVNKADAFYAKDRYFPVIADNEGRRCDFAAKVEWQLAYLLNPDLRWDKMRGLYRTILLTQMQMPRPPIDPADMPLPF